MNRTVAALLIAVTNFWFVAAWVVGWVLAHGFWSTLAAFMFPPWGWYLLAERALIAAGWV